MSRLLNIFRSNRSTKPATSARPQLARPSLESLEDRWMPSTSSPNVHAVMPATGNSAAAFFINPDNQGLMEKTPQNTVVELYRSVPHVLQILPVNLLSAGLDRSGNPDAFVQSGGQMWEWAGGSYTLLNQPEPMLSFAAVGEGRAYFEGQDHALWQYVTPYTQTYKIVIGGHIITYTETVGGWSQLAGANSVDAVDAVTQPATGTDYVFARGTNFDLVGYNVASGAWSYLAFPNGYLSFSAGLDENGYAVVWMQEVEGKAVTAYDTNPAINHGTFVTWYLNNQAYAEAATPGAPMQRWYFVAGLSDYATMISASSENSAAVLEDGNFLGYHNVTAVSQVMNTYNWDTFFWSNGHLYENVTGLFSSVTHEWY